MELGIALLSLASYLIIDHLPVYGYLGVFMTLCAAVAGNLAVAFIIGASKSDSAPVPEPEPTEEKTPHSYMLFILFLTGFISPSYETARSGALAVRPGELHQFRKTALRRP